MLSTQRNKIRLASELTFDSIVDGPGLRCVIWTQGCNHHCKDCHNPQTHDVCGGMEVDVQTLIQQINNSNLQSGLTLSGGEPFLQANSLIPIVEAAKKRNMNIWAYTGFVFEELKNNRETFELLKLIDVLVDGKFMIEKKDYRLLFKGSSNQRIIDVQKSIIENKIVLSKYEENNILESK